MQKYIKNLIITIAVATVLIGGANSAFASFTYDYTSPVPDTTFVTINCTTGSLYFSEYKPDGTLISSVSCPTQGFTNLVGILGTYNFVEFNDWTDIGYSTLTLALASPYFVSSSAFSWGTTPPTPPPTVAGISFFGGHTNATGSVATYETTDMVDQTASALGATMNGIGPISAIVIGLILTFIVARYVISLFKKTATTKKIENEKPNWAPKGTRLVRKSMGLWVRE